jgi:hypothetical protein
MRNLISLGRTRLHIQDKNIESPVTAIAPLPSSNTDFFIACGPTLANSEIRVFRATVPLQSTSLTSGRQNSFTDIVADESLRRRQLR